MPLASHSPRVLSAHLDPARCAICALGLCVPQVSLWLIGPARVAGLSTHSAHTHSSRWDTCATQQVSPCSACVATAEAYTLSLSGVRRVMVLSISRDKSKQSVMPPFFLLRNIATTSLSSLLLLQLTGPRNKHAGSKRRSCCGPRRFGLHNVNVSQAAQVLYGNLNAEIDGSDYLGDAAKYIKLYNQLQAELSSGAHP